MSLAPGPVDGFNIITGHDEGGTYQTLIVEWKIPQLLQRNSKITGYKFMWNDTTEVGSYNLSDINSRVENTTDSTQKQ